LVQRINVLEADAKKKASETSGLEEKHRLLEAKNRSLEEECDRLIRTRGSLEQANSAHRNEIESLTRKWRAATAKSQKLNEIILARGRDIEPLDSDVKARFREIRDAIQKIVHKYYAAPDEKYFSRRESRNRQIRDRQQALFHNWGKIDVEDKRLLIRSYIYGMVQEELFSKLCFGMDDETEGALVRFEELLGQTKDCECQKYRYRDSSLLFISKRGGLD
jgi:chromosome segregation ATPase